MEQQAEEVRKYFLVIGAKVVMSSTELADVKARYNTFLLGLGKGRGDLHIIDSDGKEVQR